MCIIRVTTFNQLITSAAVIGFDPISYTVIEGVNLSANLRISLISGQLGHDVIVLLKTQSLTATGM